MNLVDTMTRRGVYLYGFSRPGVPIDAGVRGVDGQAEVVELSIGHGVAALLSTIGIDELGPLLAPDQPLDPAWVIPRACRHERVIEAVMASSSVMPVRFGTVFSSDATLVEHAARRHDDISRFLDRVAGKEEWGIKVFLDLESAIARLMELDPEWSERCRGLPAAPGARYFQRKALDQSARRHALGRGRLLAESTVESLRSRCESLSYGRGSGASPPTAGDPLLRAALLLPSRDVAEFLTQVEALAAPLREAGLDVKASGPWPPYHFCPTFD